MWRWKWFTGICSPYCKLTIAVNGIAMDKEMYKPLYLRIIYRYISWVFFAVKLSVFYYFHVRFLMWWASFNVMNDDFCYILAYRYLRFFSVEASNFKVMEYKSAKSISMWWYFEMKGFNESMGKVLWRKRRRQYNHAKVTLTLWRSNCMAYLYLSIELVNYP